MEERDMVVIDLDGCVCVDTNKQGSGGVMDDEISLTVTCSSTSVADELAKAENPASLSSNHVARVGGGRALCTGGTTKEKSRSLSTAKKPPRPPQPRGLSLDGVDHRLIKELSELAKIKGARREQIKKMKAAKANNASTSSSPANYVAMLFTILFCIVIIFRGCHPTGILLSNSPAAGISNT